MEKILQSIAESLRRIQNEAKINPDEMIGVLRSLDDELKDMADNFTSPMAG